MPTPSYDALIIGSGITGGWAAKELTEKGLNTLILEAGRPIVPDKDYVEHVPDFSYPRRLSHSKSLLLHWWLSQRHGRSWLGAVVCARNICDP